jgi:hypothetical protein
MVKYYKPVIVNKKILVEDIEGNLIDYNPIFKKIVVLARKKNMAVRLPTDEKNIKLASVVDITIFNANKGVFE